MHSTVFQDEEVGLEAPAFPSAHEAVLAWLDQSGPNESLGILARLSMKARDDLAQLNVGDLSIPSMYADGCLWSMNAIEETWHSIARPGNYWSRVCRYAPICVCSVRGPIQKLKRLVSHLARQHESPVAGYIYGGILCTPEAAARAESATRATDHAREVLRTFGEECFQLGRDGHSQERISTILESDLLIAAISANWFPFNWLLGTTDSVDGWLGKLKKMKSEFGYLSSLGIGDAHTWGRDRGRDHTICIIDSGADESHPMLQQQVKHYARFDVHGHEKEAYACMDQACHGTKIGGLACGRSVLFSQLGLDFPGQLQLGIAPAAKLIVLSCLNGDFCGESGTWEQLFSGLKNAVQLKSRFCHQIVNLSVETNSEQSPETKKSLNELLSILLRNGIVPIMAAGNRGAYSNPLGDRGFYIGAVDSNGNACDENGSRCDLLAPGKDLICPHPATKRLNDFFLDEYSGSSLSCALVSGAVALVASAKGVSALEAMNILIASARDNTLSIDSALQM
jgi:hypothetical protein